VAKVEPGTSRSFEQVRDEVLARARRDRGFDMIYEVSNRIDDSLAGGTPLEEVASKQGMAITKVPAVDATGKAPDGGNAAARARAAAAAGSSACG